MNAIPIDIILQSKNYRLRLPSESDYDFIFSATRYSGFNDGMQWDPPADKSDLIQPLQRAHQAWKEGRAYGFTIETKENRPKRVGKISIRRTEEIEVWNVGFWTHPESQGNGIMTEVLATILNFGFTQLDATKITAHYALWNIASEKVLTKNGFEFSRRFEKGMLKNGKWVAENEYAIFKV